ncbi:MAG TPA: metal ABC transporter permease [Tepidisphaeraceae bacterium]|nr:metal ABC transporter permease [Tepidisphaeraceae bacterium]
MSDAIQELFDLAQLLAPALLTAGAVGIAASVLGVFVILRREALAALALPQAVAVGSAIGFRLGFLTIPETITVHIGWPTLPPALAVTAATVGFLAWSRRSGAQDWLLPSMYVGALCCSILIVSGAGQHLADLQNLYVGVEVAVDAHVAEYTVPAALLAAALTAALWRRWLLLAQARAAAELAGLRPQRWDALFLGLLASIVLLGTNALGIAMVLAMLFLPAAAALPWARRLPFAMLASAGFSLLFLLGGLLASYAMDWPLSQSVGGLGFAIVLMSHGLSVMSRWK